MNNKNYVSLHNHSSYSLLDGASKVTEIVQRTIELGQKAVALTDHGTMAGSAEFYAECVKNNIKPIIAIEAYITPRGHSCTERTIYDVKELRGQPGHERNNYHINLIALNNTGYENLCRLCTLSYSKGYYYRPRIDCDLLAKHSDGILVQSACILGSVQHYLFCNDYERAKEEALWYKNLFGDNYYFEIMNHNLSMEQKVMPELRKLSKETGIKIIATNDSHYSRKEDAKLQKSLMLLGFKKSWSDQDVSGYFFDDDEKSKKSNTIGLTDEKGDKDPIFEMSNELYIKTYDEMLEALRPFGGDNGIAEQELANTLEVAEKVNFKLPMVAPGDTDAYHVPIYPIEKDVKYKDFVDAKFEIPQSTITAVIERFHEKGEKGEKLEDFLNPYEIQSLHFLSWLAAEGMKDRIIPKIEAKGEPLPISHWCQNPPEGLKIDHAHNSPDELWIKKQDLEHPETIIKQYQDRLDFEISVIFAKHFGAYFSIVQAYANYARHCGSLVGPGRGSGAGGLINYLIGITGVDPLPNGLLFGRFISLARQDFPDLDLDFNADFRDNELKPWLRQVFGQENCSNVSTYMYFWGKAAIRAAARLLYTTSEAVELADKLCEVLEDVPKLDLHTQIDNETGNESFKKLVSSDNRNKKILQLALMLQGRISGESIHASAFIVSPHPMNNKLPMSVKKDDRALAQATGQEITNYTIMYDGTITQDVLGYVKLDLLALKDLEMLERVLKIVERVYGCTINIEKIPLDDKSVYQLLLDGYNAGVFQMDGTPVALRILQESRSDKISDWGAISALNRPAPLQLGYDQDFINGKKNPDKVTYFTPAAKEILEETYGTVCYQEELMLLSQDKRIVGLNGGQADHLRKCTAKKKKDQVALMEIEVREVAAKNNVPKKIVDDFWEIALATGSYSFNKSHALAYAFVSYWDAFMKVHFPDAFLASMCTLKPMAKKVDKIPIYLSEARQLGVKVKPPHVNYSEDSFDVPEKGVIAFGLGGIKNVGKAAAIVIGERRKNGTFKDFSDFCIRCPRQVGKQPLEALIKAGALDGLGWSRMAMEESVEEIVLFRKKWFIEQEKLSKFEDNLFGDTNENTINTIELVAPFDTEFTERQILRKEKALFGMYFSGDPENYFQLSRYKAEISMKNHYKKNIAEGKYDTPLPITLSEISQLENNTIVEFIANVEDCKGFITKTGKMMGNIYCRDWGKKEESRFGFAPTNYSIKCTCFSRVWESIVRPSPDDVVHIVGKINIDESGRWPTGILLDSIENLPSDSDLIINDNAESLIQLQEKMINERKLFADPESSIYMIPAIQFKRQTDLEAFLLDPDTEKFRGNGHVQLSVLDDKYGEFTKIHELKQTQGMVRQAAVYGGIAKKIRLPKAKNAIERAKMMENK